MRLAAPTRLLDRLGVRRETAVNLALLLALQWLGVALYAATLRAPPIWDDISQVQYQPFLQSCSNLWTVLNPRYLFWILPVRNAARPAWLASVLADTCLFGGSAAGHRLMSLLWHGAGAVLVAGLGWRWTGDRWTAWLAGLLFLCHPLHTEAVNIISFRTDLMALVFMASGLLLYWKAREARGRVAVACLAGSAAAYALAMLSKEMAVTMPLLAALGDWLGPASRPTPQAPGARRARAGAPPAAAYAAFAALLAAFLVFHTYRSGYVLGGHRDLFTAVKAEVPVAAARIAPEFDVNPEAPAGDEEAMPWQPVYQSGATRAFTMCKVLGTYLRLLVWPAALQGDYSPKPSNSLLEPAVLFAGAAWLAWLAVAWRLRRRLPAVAFGMLWVPVALLPVSGIIAIRNLEAERYLYVPSAGFCLAAAAALQRASRWWRQDRPGGAPAVDPARALGILLALAYGIRTTARNGDYRTDAAFFQATLRNDPDVARAHLNLGKTYEDSGDRDRAEAEYRTALRLWPAVSQGHILLARLLTSRARYRDAVAELEAAVAGDPADFGLRYNLGLAYWLAGRLDKAETTLVSAEGLRRGDWRADYALGSLLLQRGKSRRAIPRLAAAARAAPGRDSAMIRYRLAYAYRAAGRFRDADRVLKEVGKE